MGLERRDGRDAQGAVGGGGGGPRGMRGHVPTRAGGSREGPGAGTVGCAGEGRFQCRLRFPESRKPGGGEREGLRGGPPEGFLEERPGREGRLPDEGRLQRDGGDRIRVPGPAYEDTARRELGTRRFHLVVRAEIAV